MSDIQVCLCQCVTDMGVARILILSQSELLMQAGRQGVKIDYCSGDLFTSENNIRTSDF